MKCPKCKHIVEIDFTPEFNAKKPYELVCYACGWFSGRFETEQQLNMTGDNDG